MGDFNCRHTDWDAPSSRRGIFLRVWTARNGWHIKMPPEATCIRHNGSSAVAMFLNRGHETTGPMVEHGIGDDRIDHRPVSLITTLKPVETVGVAAIPYIQRANSVYVHKAAVHYRYVLLEVQQAVCEETSHTQTQDVYNQINEESLAPWKPERKFLPGRFKKGWTDRLEKLSRQRTKLYRKARRSNNDQDWGHTARLIKQSNSRSPDIEGHRENDERAMPLALTPERYSENLERCSELKQLQEHHPTCRKARSAPTGALHPTHVNSNG